LRAIGNLPDQLLRAGAGGQRKGRLSLIKGKIT
jgi:hypothetical protein